MHVPQPQAPGTVERSLGLQRGDSATGPNKVGEVEELKERIALCLLLHFAYRHLVSQA